MVKRCVAAGCSNTYKDGVSLFQFPRDAVLEKQWTKEVQKTRAKWQGPSDSSVLCSEHFTNDCFEEDTDLGSKNEDVLSQMLYQLCSIGICHIPPPKQTHKTIHLQVIKDLFLQTVVQYSKREQHLRREKDKGNL